MKLCRTGRPWCARTAAPLTALFARRKDGVSEAAEPAHVKQWRWESGGSGTPPSLPARRSLQSMPARATAAMASHDSPKCDTIVPARPARRCSTWAASPPHSWERPQYLIFSPYLGKAPPRKGTKTEAVVVAAVYPLMRSEGTLLREASLRWQASPRPRAMRYSRPVRDKRVGHTRREHDPAVRKPCRGIVGLRRALHKSNSSAHSCPAGHGRHDFPARPRGRC